MEALKETKELIYGQLLEVELPSGYKVTIREQNGEDDDILSNQVLAKDLSNISMFISTLVIDTDLPFATGGKLSLKDMDKMLVNDQAVILLASRIHSLGAELEFFYDWGENLGQSSYLEDLSKYLWPYITNPNYPYEREHPEYYEFRCHPYPADAYGKKEFTLTSGKKIQFKHMDVKSQKELINLPNEKNTKNTEYIIRELKLEMDGEWQTVHNFKYFTSREMKELRSIVSTIDRPFKGLTRLENPDNGQIILYPFMGNPDFFFPGEMEN